MQPQIAYTTIIECLPYLDSTHLKKVRHILNSMYGVESTPSGAESNEEAADLIHFYKVFRELLFSTCGISLREDLFISSRILKNWLGVRDFLNSLKLKSPSERIAIYRVFAKSYLDWMLEIKAPLTKKTFEGNLDRIPSLLNQQLPALANPFVLAVLLENQGLKNAGGK